MLPRAPSARARTSDCPAVTVAISVKLRAYCWSRDVGTKSALAFSVSKTDTVSYGNW